VSESDGLGALPSWWFLVLLVPFGFSAAVVAAFLLMKGAGLIQSGGAAVRRRLMRRRDTEWGDQPAAGAVYVEGRSHDPTVGRFSGFAYWMWSVAEESDEPTLLVYDPSKPAPVPATAQDLIAVNGQAIESPRSRERARQPFQWVGARVHVAERNGVDPLPGTLPVTLELFVEGDHGRWDTGPVISRPLHVRMDDIEAGVERAVMGDRLPDLVAALERRGLMAECEELRRLPFGVELTREVEFALAGKEVTHAEAG